MSSEITEPKTIRELWILIEGKFETLEERISNTRKITFWIGGISGGIIGGLIILGFKYFGGK